MRHIVITSSAFAIVTACGAVHERDTDPCAGADVLVAFEEHVSERVTAWSRRCHRERAGFEPGPASSVTRDSECDLLTSGEWRFHPEAIPACNERLDALDTRACIVHLALDERVPDDATVLLFTTDQCSVLERVGPDAGVVRRWLPAAVGDGCDPASASACGFGLRCSSTTLTCAPVAECAPGSAPSGCPTDRPYCATDGTCGTDPSTAACNVTLVAYGYDTCPEGYACPWVDPFSMSFAACLPVVSRGAACDDASICDTGSVCSEGRCVAFALDGDPCGADAACGIFSACTNGTCVPRP